MGQKNVLYGKPNPLQNCFQIWIDGHLFITLAAAALAVMAIVLNMAITMAGRRRRRRRRSAGGGGGEEEEQEEQDFSAWEIVCRQLVLGLEEFENKIDKLAGDAEGGTENDSWLGKLYHKFKDTFGGEENTLGTAEMDGMESPILDETWGLGDISKLYSDNSTMSANGTELVDGGSHNVTKRALSTPVGVSNDDYLAGLGIDEEDDEYIKSLSGETKCKTKFWKCVGKVVKGGMHYVDEPGGVWGVVQKAMFRMAFHGSYGNVWNALMTIPEARGVKRCMNLQDECLGYEAIRKEAETEDRDRPRMIVNPDFVEGLDTSDGSTQFDPDVQEHFENLLAE